MRKLQLSRGQAPRYAGTCSHLTAEEIEKRLAQGAKPAWRFRIPNKQAIEFIDLVKGPQLFQSDDIGDFIIRRADGTAPFLFCNAIDDAMMQVSHVLRGEDHVANTPRQLLLLQALNLPTPQYGHLSLIVGDDGAPLSKRHGSFSLHDLREAGFLPQAIVNYLSRLGHTYENQEWMDFSALATHFHLEKLSRSPARFDQSQLLYWQKTAVQLLDTEALWHWLGDEVRRQAPEKLQTLFAETVRPNITFPGEAVEWAAIFFHHALAFDQEKIAIFREAGEQFFVEAELAIQEHGVEFAEVLADMKETLGLSGKRLYMPLRVALTGKIHGPELVQIAQLLGKEEMCKRLGVALKSIAA